MPAIHNDCFGHISFLGRMTVSSHFQNAFTQAHPTMPMNFTSLYLFCVFRIGSGGWSTEGVTRVTVSQSENSTVVQCNSTHLTSFAVLVDVAGSQVFHSEFLCRK